MSAVEWAADHAVESCHAADACIAIADHTTSAHLRWADNAMTTNGSTDTTRLTVIAVVGRSVGVVAQNGDLSKESVTQLVRAAERTAREAPPAPDAQPLTDHRPAKEVSSPGRTSMAQLQALVPGLAVAFNQARVRGRALYGYAEHQIRTTRLASSTGLRLCHVQPTGILDLTARTTESSAWAGVSVPDFTGTDPASIAAGLHDRLSLAARRVDPPAGPCEVILSPSAVADLMLHLYWAANAQDASAGHSVFSGDDGRTRIGDRLTATPLTLYSDPFAPGLECAPFAIARSSTAAASVFDNGTPLSTTDWITDGVLTALTGRTGLGHTPQIDNLIMTGGDRTLAEMIAGTRQGLVLSSLWYLRDVDPRTLLLTGLTRDGVHLVREGEIVAAVPDFRFNESPVSLLDRIAERGRTEPALPREWGDYFTRMAMPPLRVADFPVPH
jgi:predicted Zn-dependent protease